MADWTIKGGVGEARACGVAALLAAVFTACCAYRPGTLHEYPVLSVGVFDNKTERRDHEFDLTREVIRELSRQGVRVTPSARHELRGEIVQILQPVVVDGRQDTPLVGSFGMSVRFRLVHLETGKVLSEGQISDAAAFSSARGQGLDSARHEVLARLSRTIVSKLEKGW